MDEINEDQKIILIEREHNLANNTIENEKEKKTNIINDETIDRDPYEKLKLIKERIKNENTRIKEINDQLDKINVSNNKLTNKRYIQYNDVYYTNNNVNNNKKKNNVLYPNISVTSSQQINTNSNLLTLNPSINTIHQKMENLLKIKLVRINSNKNQNDSEKQINVLEKRNNSYMKGKKANSNSMDLRVLFLEEEVKKDKEEKQKKYDQKIQLFREKELEREKQRKKLINEINNISLSQKNKYLPKKNYITSEEKEEIRKMKEESLYRIENEKRKFKYQPISSEELNNFSNEVKKNEKILKIELDKKKKQMEELWKERKNLIPKYHSKFMDLNIELDNEAKGELILKQEKLKNKELGRANFGKIIIKNFQPKILNDKLKTEREQRIKELKGINRLGDIKE